MTTQPLFDNLSDNPQDQLLTVRDVFRYAISQFHAAGLAFGHGTTTALDEAAFLVLEALHLPIDQLSPFLDARLLTSERALVLNLIDKRVVTRIPTPYLLGKAYIQGIPFICDARAIIPRSFIAELLLSDQLISSEDNAGLISDAEAITSVLDLCTGGGSLAIIAAKQFQNAHVKAVDISEAALSLAHENITLHGLDERITLLQSDLFAALLPKPKHKRQKFDLIISNPPYVNASAMAALPAEYRHEPTLALDGGDDGLDFVRKILEIAPDFLSPEGALLCEIGTGREILEAACPNLPFLWLDTQESFGEVFWLNASDF